MALGGIPQELLTPTSLVKLFKASGWHLAWLMCCLFPQEPEKAKPAAEEANGKAEEEAPKGGLPALGPKPKKKSAAAAPSEPAKQAEA